MNEYKNFLIVILIIICLIIGFLYRFIIKDEKNNFEIDNLDLEVNNEKTNEIDTRTEKKKILVYITGEVNVEGVYELEENSRVKDCIEMAGGLKEEADIKDINLVDILDDGMKIYIPKKGENIIYETESTIVNADKNDTNKKININTAQKDDLKKIVGIGEAMADRIIEYRQKNGKFKNIEEIKNIKGIGKGKFEKIKKFIMV